MLNTTFSIVEKYIHHTFKLNACPDNASSLSIPSKHQEISCVRKVTSASNELIFSKKLKVIYLHKKIHTIQTHNNYKNSQIEPNYFPSWQNQSKIAVEAFIWNMDSGLLAWTCIQNKLLCKYFLLTLLTWLWVSKWNNWNKYCYHSKSNIRKQDYHNSTNIHLFSLFYSVDLPIHMTTALFVLKAILILPCASWIFIFFFTRTCFNSLLSSLVPYSAVEISLSHFLH